MKKLDFKIALIAGFIMGFSISEVFDVEKGRLTLFELEAILKAPPLTACDWSVIESVPLPDSTYGVVLITEDGFEKALAVRPSHKQFNVFKNLENGDCIRFYHTDEEMDPEDYELQFIRVEFLDNQRKDYQRLTGRLRRPVFLLSQPKNRLARFFGVSFCLG